MERWTHSYTLHGNLQLFVRIPSWRAQPSTNHTRTLSHSIFPPPIQPHWRGDQRQWRNPILFIHQSSTHISSDSSPCLEVLCSDEVLLKYYTTRWQNESRASVNVREEPCSWFKTSPCLSTSSTSFGASRAVTASISITLVRASGNAGRSLLVSSWYFLSPASPSAPGHSTYTANHYWSTCGSCRPWQMQSNAGLRINFGAVKCFLCNCLIFHLCWYQNLMASS